MYAENNLTFKDIEDCRHRLRYIEGKTGENLRKHTKKTEFFKGGLKMIKKHKESH